MRKFLSAQSGRSMIEMLGVLAIMAVLAVGGISGYSKVMAKRKQSQLADQISTMITNIRTLYNNKAEYTGLTTAKAISKGVVPKEMIAGTNSIKTVYGGDVYVYVMSSNPEQFRITVHGLPQSACVYLASYDWGSRRGSGWIAVRAQSTPQHMLTNNYKWFQYNIDSNTLPMPISAAATSCTSASTNSIVLIFE